MTCGAKGNRTNDEPITGPAFIRGNGARSTTAASVQEAAAGGEPASSSEAEGDKGDRTTGNVSEGRSSRPDLNHRNHALPQGGPSRPDSQ